MIINVERLIRVQELCESRGGRPGFFRPNEPYGFRVHKVTRLCPHVTTFCRRRQEAEAESNPGRSANGLSALPLGHTGLRLKTVPLVHLLNAQLSRSRPVERQMLAGTEIPDTPGVPPRLHHQKASHQDTGSGISHSNVSFTVGRCRQMSHTQFTLSITRQL